jgi:hypothetical protein
LTSDRHDRLTTVAAIWAVAISAGLALWVLLRTGGGGGSLATPILLAPCIAGILAYLKPRNLAVLFVAILLLLGTIVLLLIGFAGLLYLPSLVLLILAAGRAIAGRERRRTFTSTSA